MKQNNVLALAIAAIGATGATGVANANNYGLTLTNVTSYSNQGAGFAIATLTGTTLPGWTYNTATNLVTAPGPYADKFFVGITPIFSHTILGLVMSSVGAPSAATSYTCVEGTFGSSVGASLCGNYNFGANFINESTTSWGPGLAHSRTQGGDDVLVGPEQNLTFYDGFSIIGTVGATVKFGNTDNNANLANAHSGYSFTFNVNPPNAADDGTIYVTNGVAKVIPVGANDTSFIDPVTIIVTTPPTNGTITAISAPGPAAGMTITYTANVGPVGPDSFVYQMTDGTPTSDSATVTINISPDTDTDGQPDNNDNCRLVANMTAGLVPNSPSVPKAQLDSDADGYGNACDADVNNSGGTTASDYAILRSVIGKLYNFSVNAAKSDINASGSVTAADYAILRSRIGTPPGPSGLACAGTVPCVPAP